MLVMIAEWDRVEGTWWKRRNAQPSITKSLRQAERLKLLYPAHHVQQKNTGEFSVIAHVLPLSSPDIAPFVSCCSGHAAQNSLAF